MHVHTALASLNRVSALGRMAANGEQEDDFW
jgi:hypothetical protein